MTCCEFKAKGTELKLHEGIHNASKLIKKGGLHVNCMENIKCWKQLS